MQKIGLLNEDQCAGQCKFGRHSPVRLTSGVESGRRLVDVTLVHVIELDDEIQAISTFLPGAAQQFYGAFGEHSDGVRENGWKPLYSSKRIVIAPPGDAAPIYEGPADMKRAILRVLGKSCTFTIHLRLRSVEPSALPRMAELLGEVVAYQILTERIAGPQTAEPVEGGLPFGGATVAGTVDPQGGQAIEREPVPGIEGPAVQVGDLVVALQDSEEVVGRATAVNDGWITIHRQLDGSEPITVPMADITSVQPLCGAKGGLDVSRTLKRILDCRDEAGNRYHVSPDDLLAGLVATIDRNQITRLPQGWPLTDEVVEATHEAARNREELEPDQFEEEADEEQLEDAELPEEV